jgi:hypothetical protein
MRILRWIIGASIAVSTALLAQTTPPDTLFAPEPAPPPRTAPAAWSEVTGQQWSNIGARDRAAGVIRRVDGRSVHESRVRIEPGERDIVVRSPPRHGFGGTERHMRLKAEPCRRYYVNVAFRSASGTDWKPVVAKTEPIVGCRLSPRP